jgi:hypothetical protein
MIGYIITALLALIIIPLVIVVMTRKPKTGESSHRSANLPPKDREPQREEPNVAGPPRSSHSSR